MMTEAEWLECADPVLILALLRQTSSTRKLRLFACACCCRFRHLMVEWVQESLEVAERFAEGAASQYERRHARERAFQAGWVSDPSTAHRRGPAKACVCDALARSAYAAAIGSLPRSSWIGLLSKKDWAPSALQVKDGRERIVDWSSGKDEQNQFHVNLLRDIFGNPFHPVTINPSWRTPSVIVLAQTIYDERAFDRLPELADALVNAGCDNQDILSHCRSEGPHVRGCWVVDLVLGKG